MRKSALFAFGLVVTALVALGLVVLSSASEANGIRLYNNAYHFITRQAIYLVLAVGVGVASAWLDYRLWRSHWWLTVLFYVIVLALLLAVFAFPPINGSRRWLPLGLVRLQPSEFAKLVIVIVVAVWLDKAAWRVERFVRGALLPFVFIGILALPILLEPDFGSVMVVVLAAVLVMFVAEVRLLHLLPFVLLGAAVFVYKLFGNANRMGRLTSFFGMDVGDPQFYQLLQALVALKNGGIQGVGLNQSMQKHFYLPEAHTDFIFAIGAEELGLFFSLGAVALYLAFFALSVYIASKASDRFGRYLAIGMTFIIFFQAMFNIAVICGALPTKGMALPFFSYGGTNLLSSFFAVGTILSVGIHSYRERRRGTVHAVRFR